MPQPCLVVTCKPVKVFYKDEGGKSNFLSATIALPSAYTGPAVPLKASLYFECGRRVEEQDQDILSLLDYKYTPAVVAPNKPCVIRYRLEKVSRRKDNQRFKMFVEVDYSGAAAAAAGGPQRIGGAFTTPVSVLSKRKTGQRFVVRRNPSPQQRMEEFTDTLRSICDKLGSKVDALHTAVAANTRVMREQGARLERLESLVMANSTRQVAASSAAATFPDVTTDAGVDVLTLAPPSDNTLDTDTDNATMNLLSSLMDVGAFEAAQTADLAAVPPLRRSFTKELIDSAVAASFAMNSDRNITGAKRSRQPLAVSGPAGGSESGDDSPTPATTEREPLPRIKLTTGEVHRQKMPRVRRWRSMEITFSRPAALGRAAKRARA